MNKEEQSSSPIGNNGFNLDELVKKIDARIAELEEEEKKEKEQNKNNGVISPTVIEEKSIESISSVEEEIQRINQELDDHYSPKLEKHEVKDKRVIEDITDDQFFDDFFNDEE